MNLLRTIIVSAALRGRRMRRALWLLSASAVVLLAMTPSLATAVTFPFERFSSLSPTLVVSDSVSGAAIGSAAAATSITTASTYTDNIDAVPPSFFLVDGANKPVQIAFQEFTGSWQGAPVTVSNLVVELRVGGGQVLGYRPTSDGLQHFPLAFQQTSFTVVSGVFSSSSFGTFDLQGIPLQSIGPGPEVITDHNLFGGTVYDVNLDVGPLAVSLGGLTMEISNPGQFGCMDCGFDLPQGPPLPTIPEPSTALLLTVGLGSLSVVRRRMRPTA